MTGNTPFSLPLPPPFAFPSFVSAVIYFPRHSLPPSLAFFVISNEVRNLMLCEVRKAVG